MDIRGGLLRTALLQAAGSADFGATAAIYAGIVFAVVLLAAGFIHLFVRHESMKLELKIMLNMGILLIGLLVNASAADSTVVYATVSNVEWGALAALTAGTAASSCWGCSFQK